jgi:DNA-binding CsgD family transcriptional regulator
MSADIPPVIAARLADAIDCLRQTDFPVALWEVFRALARPDNLIVLAYRDRGPPLVLDRRFGGAQVFARLETAYLAGAYRLDPYFDLHLQRGGEGAYRLRDIAPDAFSRSRYVVEYFGQTTLIDEIAFVVPLAEGLSLNLCLGRDSGSAERFTAAEFAACQRLAPVVAALARAEWRGIKGAPGPVEDTPALLVEASRRRGIALTPRQAEVALLILRGHSTGSIGLSLGLSPQTVKVFRRQLYQRCAISSQAELFAIMLPLLSDAVQKPGAQIPGAQIPGAQKPGAWNPGA